MRLWTLAGLVCLVPACLGDIEVSPAPPTIDAVDSPTPVARQTLTGSKPADTEVLDGDTVVVPLDDATTWSFDLDLVPGDNTVSLTTRRASGRQSESAATATIVFEPPCPSSPRLMPVPRRTQDRNLTFSGTKQPQTEVLLQGSVVVPADAPEEFTINYELDDLDGEQELVFVARDAKGDESDPVRVVVVLDRSPPEIVASYPLADDTGIVTNARVMVVFSESIDIPGIEPPADLLQVFDGNQRVSGSLSYELRSLALSWFPQSGFLPTDRVLRVEVDPSMVQDLVGNQATGGAQWTFSFTSSSTPQVLTPPAPTLDAVPAQVTENSVVLTGSKGAFASVRLGPDEIVPPTQETTWMAEYPLVVGTTTAAITSRSVTDDETAGPLLSVERVDPKPEPPTLTDPAEQVSAPAIDLIGTRPANTSVLLDGNPVVCRGAETDWAFTAALSPGANDLRLQTRDENGATSDPLVHTVTFEQTYEGTVPPDFALRVDFTLRDLSKVAEIRNEFVTGPNNFAVEAWVEGPIDLGEECVMTNGQRQNVKYVATIQHYIGTKAQHKVPFADEDYRGTDYLAALINGGAFSFLGLTGQSQRRQEDGREQPGLLASLTEGDLRTNIDCFGSPVIDICTQPTQKDGRISLVPWNPRRREGNGPLEQGDYLLFVQLNLDRDGSWLSANDVETCWGNPADNSRGMHRVVSRISLGSEPYVLEVPQELEFSGADREGSGKLYFISEEGVTITWGPAP